VQNERRASAIRVVNSLPVQHTMYVGTTSRFHGRFVVMSNNNVIYYNRFNPLRIGVLRVYTDVNVASYIRDIMCVL
jgi:hypothetical protein